ncbi:amidohydrolase family protein [Cellulosilyticum ruminicola]|uniref:amidohydrolase family protein n=1 Tax=Cellulosilyticum ruminicola TaxID=425254 RepID=UPI001A9A42EA|nr:amidohydrolase family protein [Cellulosilyticum ruminicola]
MNDYVIEQVQKYPDELVGFIAVVPNHPKVTDEIERCVKSGLKGIGELFPAGQKFDISSLKDTSAMQKPLSIIIYQSLCIPMNQLGMTM